MNGHNATGNVSLTFTGDARSEVDWTNATIEGRRLTHAQQILVVLGDGEWHTSAEIHRHVFCVLHSRIAELRRRGYVIEHRGGGGGAANHSYRWLLDEVAA